MCAQSLIFLQLNNTHKKKKFCLFPDLLFDEIECLLFLSYFFLICRVGGVYSGNTVFKVVVSVASSSATAVVVVYFCARCASDVLAPAIPVMQHRQDCSCRQKTGLDSTSRLSWLPWVEARC